MRIFLTLAIAVVLLGSVYLYTQFARNVRAESVEFVIDFADEEYTVEVRKSFEAVPNFLGESLKIMLKGKTLLLRDDRVAADEVVEFGPIEGVETGQNAVYVWANRGDASEQLAVVQVAIKKDGVVIAQQNIVSESGLDILSDEIVFVGGETKHAEHEH